MMMIRNGPSCKACQERNIRGGVLRTWLWPSFTKKGGSGSEMAGKNRVSKQAIFPSAVIGKRQDGALRQEVLDRPPELKSLRSSSQNGRRFHLRMFISGSG